MEYLSDAAAYRADRLNTRSKATFLPTPKQIRERAAKVRAGWSERETKKRRLLLGKGDRLPDDPLVIPIGLRAGVVEGTTY